MEYYIIAIVMWLVSGVLWGLLDHYRDVPVDKSPMRHIIPDWLYEWYNGFNSIWECYYIFKLNKKYEDIPKWLLYKPGGFIQWLWCFDYWHGVKNTILVLHASAAAIMTYPTLGLCWSFVFLVAILFAEGYLGFTPTYHTLEKNSK